MNLFIVGALAVSLIPLAAAQTPPTPTGIAPAATGIWLGTLQAGPTKLRLQLHIQPDNTCALDSLDQGAMGIKCTNLTLTGSKLLFTVPAVGASYVGTLSADGKTLTGTFTQGADLPLTFERQTAATTATAPKPPAMDAALPPVKVEDLKAVLDKDLAAALTKGALAPETHAGITIGVVQHGVRRIFTYGTAKPDSVYEIGSISKTFTGLILAQMVEQKKVRLDEPVRELLPVGTVAKPATGWEITLLDLSDQHSGLPRMPDNFNPADPANPYADYDAKLLYAFIAKHGVARSPDAPFGYSNLGVGLLGQALANRANMPYPQLLAEQLTTPLGLKDTAIHLTPSMQSRFIQGYAADHLPAHAWDLDALAGAGGIRSTAADMLTYLEAQLHPEKVPSLTAAITASHVPHAEAGPGMQIGLNWFWVPKHKTFWHNGATGGYSSYALFNPDQDFAIVVLSNTGPGSDSFTDRLAGHIATRLMGEPAPSLAP